MSVELTNEEKLSIANQHLRNLKSNEYNVQLSIREESVVPLPDQTVLDKLSLDLSNTQAKIAAVLSEIETLGA